MSKLSLSVQYANNEDEPPSRARCGALVRAAWRATAADDGQITVRFTDTTEITRLNKRYRQKNRPTNVLSFCYDSKPIYGDIVICNTVVRLESDCYGIAIADRYAHLIVHGVLHLQGHTHDTPHATAAMEMLEDKILSNFNIANPYLIPS